MLTLGYFNKWPAIYSDREKLIRTITFNKLTPTFNENKTISIESSTDKYTQKIEILDENIHLNSQCKVFCSCESFKFEFANSISKHESLLEPMNFIKSIIERPKEKNKYNIPSGCKHIIALARQIIRRNIKKQN